MFAVRILFDENLVPDSVVIWDPRSVFSYEILLDKFLFAGFNIGPVGFKADIVDVPMPGRITGSRYARPRGCFAGV